MSCSSNCCGAADFFGDRIARRNMRKYRRSGPFGTTKRLLAALDEAEAPKDTLRDDVPTADVVTLDKVVCCYVDMESLIATSASRARRLMALAYPRDDWWVRAMVAAGNFMVRLRGDTFRSYVHRNSDIEAALGRAGLTRRSL